MLEKKTITLNRQKLYEEIWEKAVSGVAKEYDIPFGKLKDSCQKANIPLPTLSYWGNKGIGKPVAIPELPDSEINEVIIEFSKRKENDTIETAESIQNSSAVETTISGNEKSNAIHNIAHEKSSFGTNIYNREQLYQEVWDEPVTKIAEKYGVSDVMIHKVCKSMNIPVPPRGYWAKKKSGQQVEVVPLPKDSEKDLIIGVKKEEEVSENEFSSDNLGFLDDNTCALLLNAASALKIQDNNHKLHRVLLQHKAAYKAWKANHPRDVFANWKERRWANDIPENEPEFWESVSEQTLPRLYIILDAILIASAGFVLLSTQIFMYNKILCNLLK